MSDNSQKLTFYEKAGYSAAEQELDVIISRPPQSVADLYPERPV